MGYTYTDVEDSVVKLVKGGSVVGNSMADTVTKWPSGDAPKVYGNNSEMWGSALTPDDVNASDFGMVLSAEAASGTARVDAITMTVFYSVPAQQDTPSLLSVMHVSSGRTVTAPYIYEVPLGSLKMANDPAMDKAADDVRLRTSRYYRPGRMLQKGYTGWEFYAKLTPETNTPGLQVWGIVEDGTPVQLLDADGAPATVYASGHHRVFFPAGTTGRWAAIEYRVPAVSGGQVPVAVEVREGRLLGAIAPRRRSRLFLTLVLGDGNYRDQGTMRRSVMTQKADLDALYGQVVSFKAPAGEEGYATVAAISYKELFVKEHSSWRTTAELELREELYA